MIQSTKKIIVPIDFSEQSLIALEQSYNLAKEYHAEITLIYVIEEGSALFKFFSSQQHDDMKKTIQEKLDVLASDVSKKTGVKVNTLVAKGHIYEKIAEVAELINATMIVMGTNGDGGLKKRFIGSKNRFKASILERMSWVLICAGIPNCDSALFAICSSETARVSER